MEPSPPQTAPERQARLHYSSDRRLFIIDTNVLLHDPAALFRFKEHNILLPMVVLEELDQSKKGLSEVARNARQVSRFLDELISRVGLDEIAVGIALPAQTGQAAGRLFFDPKAPAPAGSAIHADNALLATALAIKDAQPEVAVTLVSKDINLRIKAATSGLNAEDYYNDQVLEDVRLLYSGLYELPTDFWEAHSQDLKVWQDNERTYYKVRGPLVRHWHPNQCLFLNGAQPLEAVIKRVESDTAILAVARHYTSPPHAVWGIHARNLEQNFALNLLLDPEVDFVTLVGVAGSGKTLLSLAAGLAQTLDQQRFREIIMTRVTVPLGEDIGYLPGTEEEKMTPWMGALMDNLEVLVQNDAGGGWGRQATADLLRNRIKIRSLNFMRGRTFLNRYIILDEAQNLTPKQMKALITRAGPGTKIVCLGNIAQIDTPYLTETTSGLTYVVERFQHWPYSGHITLTRGERSRLADFATERL